MKICTPTTGKRTFKDLDFGDVFMFVNPKHQDGNYRLRIRGGYVIFGDNVFMDRNCYDPTDLEVLVFPDATLTVGRKG